MKPDFLIIGAAKSGTTALWHYLKQHPDLFLPDKKECHFFCHEEMHESQKQLDNTYRPILTIEEYQHQFRESTGKARGEASPLYMYYPNTAHRIKSANPKTKIIAILRNPADRAYAAWLHLKRDRKETFSFEKALAAENQRAESSEFHPGFFYRRLGEYDQQLQQYFATFPREQIAIFRFEDLKKDPHSTVNQICKFIGVREDFSFDCKVKLNISGLPRNQWLHNFLGHRIHENSFFNVVKRPFPENIWIRIIKGLQSKNLEKPKVNQDTRNQLLDYYRSGITALSKDFDIDCMDWLH